MRELYKLYLEIGHDAFEEKIKKPMEFYLHNNHDSSNIISMNSLDTIIANTMENYKLGEAGFDEYDLFSPPSFEEEICFDDTLPPIYDDYNNCDILVPPTLEDKVYFDYDMPGQAAAWLLSRITELFLAAAAQRSESRRFGYFWPFSWAIAHSFLAPGTISTDHDPEYTKIGTSSNSSIWSFLAVFVGYSTQFFGSGDDFNGSRPEVHENWDVVKSRRLSHF